MENVKKMLKKRIWRVCALTNVVAISSIRFDWMWIEENHSTNAKQKRTPNYGRNRNREENQVFQMTLSSSSRINLLLFLFWNNWIFLRSTQSAFAKIWPSTFSICPSAQKYSKWKMTDFTFSIHVGNIRHSTIDLISQSVHSRHPHTLFRTKIKFHIFTRIFNIIFFSFYFTCAENICLATKLFRCYRMNFHVATAKQKDSMAWVWTFRNGVTGDTT